MIKEPAYWIVNVGLASVGLSLILWAGPLSIRYNAWTTQLRGKHPNFNPPPTPQWRTRNTRIMTVVFRIAGAVFLLRSLLNLAAPIVVRLAPDVRL